MYKKELGIEKMVEKDTDLREELKAEQAKIVKIHEECDKRLHDAGEKVKLAEYTFLQKSIELEEVQKVRELLFFL